MPVDRLLVVTLDSCRFDTAEAASTPFLDSIARLEPAMSHASFTLPAHVALFYGYPPTPLHPALCAECGGPERGVFARLPHYARWGKAHADARGTLAGQNLIDAMRASGFKTIGCAGMRWFQTPQLRTGFESFHYWGPDHDPSDRDLPAWAPEHFALNHVSDLIQGARGHDKWLLFVNAAETHAPYMADDAVLGQMRELAHLRNGKSPVPQSAQGLMRELHAAQRNAMEIADQRIRVLFEALPGPFHYVVTADHGEAFGEDELWGHVLAHPTVSTVPLWQGRYV